MHIILLSILLSRDNMFNKDKKIVQVANYITEKLGGKVDKIQLLKLIWLSDRLHVRIYGRLVTYNTYFAMQHGPVPSEMKDLFEHPTSYFNEYLQKKSLELNSVKPTDKYYLSETDIKVMDSVISDFGEMDIWTLRDLTHEFPEWLRFEKQINKSKSSYRMVMADFFEPNQTKYRIFDQDSEMLEFSKEDFFHMLPQA